MLLGALDDDADRCPALGVAYVQNRAFGIRGVRIGLLAQSDEYGPQGPPFAGQPVLIKQVYPTEASSVIPATTAPCGGSRRHGL